MKKINRIPVAILIFVGLLGCQGGFESASQDQRGATCKAESGGFTLNWIPASNYDSTRYAYTGFEIMYGTASGAHSESFVVAADATSSSVLGPLLGHQEYYFVVRALYSDNQNVGQTFYTEKSNEICKFTRNAVSPTARATHLASGGLRLKLWFKGATAGRLP